MLVLNPNNPPFLILPFPFPFPFPHRSIHPNNLPPPSLSYQYIPDPSPQPLPNYLPHPSTPPSRIFTASHPSSAPLHSPLCTPLARCTCPQTLTRGLTLLTSFNSALQPELTPTCPRAGLWVSRISVSSGIFLCQATSVSRGAYWKAQFLYCCVCGAPWIFSVLPYRSTPREKFCRYVTSPQSISPLPPPPLNTRRDSPRLRLSARAAECSPTRPALVLLRATR